MEIKPLKIDKEVQKSLAEKLDPRSIKIKPFSSGARYIGGSTCIALLNKAFGFNWSMRIVERWIEPGYPFKEKSGDITEQSPTAWCIVELTVPFKDENGNIVYITKNGFGSQAVTGKQKEQSGNMYKGAQTDALKKAATLFGVALELYNNDEEALSAFDEINGYIFDPWTEELQEKYAKEWAYVDKICELNGYEYDDLLFWTNGKNVSYLEPEELVKLVNALKTDEDIVKPEEA